MICRPCEIAGYLTEDGWDDYAAMWHDQCKGHGCGCDHGKRTVPVNENHPHFGLTKHGLPVHLHVLDYHAADTWYQKRTQKLAQFITKHIGTMNCFFAFNILALLSLPATLKLAGIHVNALYTAIPAFFLTFGWIYLITWICQNYIQLVLLPALMVGQNLQNQASDARAAKSFEDIEAVRTDLITALDRLDVHTEGGLKAVLDAVNALAPQGNAGGF